MNQHCPPMPQGRAHDVKQALEHLKLKVGGNHAVIWERFCLFVALFPNDQKVATLSNTAADLVEIVTQHATADVNRALRQLWGDEDIVHVLQSRLTLNELVEAFNAKGRFSALSDHSRPEVVKALLHVYKGSPPLPHHRVNPLVRTLVDFANGAFDRNEFEAGSSVWRLRQGDMKAWFSPSTVYAGYQAHPTVPITVITGLFTGKRFPTPAEAKQIYQLATHGRGSLQDDEVAIWIYHNLGSSSYFNDLFSAADFFLTRVDDADEICPTCEQCPCLALNRELPPVWIGRVGHSDPENAPAWRFTEYRDCHQKYGGARVPLPDCWVLAIRCAFPGGPITGFRPRFLHAVNEQVAVEVADPVNNELEDRGSDSEDAIPEEHEEHEEQEDEEDEEDDGEEDDGEDDFEDE